MTLAIFDLDNTLLSSDSDYEWGQFMVNKGIVDKQEYEQANIVFYEQYKNGTLDIHEYSQFAFTPLTKHPIDDLLSWRSDFLKEIIEPLITNKAKGLVELHKQLDHNLMVITATNSFVTAPIVESLGIVHLLATEPKQIDGRYVAEIEGTPCFQEGKVARLNAWLEEHDESMEGSIFYSDSHNDLPLLEIVDTPIAVDPDEELQKIAQKRGWEVISLRG